MLNSILLERRDMLAILPTGHGKSLPFQITAATASKLSSRSGFEHLSGRDIAIVACPLLAIMNVQIKQLKKAGIPACSLHDENEKQADIIAGKYGTPKFQPVRRSLLIIHE